MNRVRMLQVNVVCLGITIVLAWSSSANSEVWHGLYVDATSYEPNDAIKVYASAPNADMVFRLVRLGTEWTEVVRTESIMVGPQSSYLGSFIEYPDLSISERTSFTLEGWFHPTLLGGDTVVVAGQFGMTEAAAAIIITSKGRLAAYVNDSPQTDETRLAIAPASQDFVLWLDQWHHLAMSYDGAQVKLYLNGKLAAERAQTGPVAMVSRESTPFRLGARSEAPGDLTGVIDGRLDSWALWPTALSAKEVRARRGRGLEEDDPAPDPAEVDLYVGFEGPYPSVADTSHNRYAAVVTNHGTPGISGVTLAGRAFRLNHDKIVDAGWDVTTELIIPPGTPSGMYAIQALHGDPPAQVADPLSVQAFAVKPAADGPRAPMAVVLPTNTWTVYTTWPGIGRYGPGGITPRSRRPGGNTIPVGNNSGYKTMGDGVSYPWYHGFRRPMWEASPMKPGADVADYNMRAPNSMYLVQWLDLKGFDYDVYSDADFAAGVISASDYRVLMPHGHHEYWSNGMLEALTRFLDEGGSVVAPAGNMFGGTRVVYGPDDIVEARRKKEVIGLADLFSGIDGEFMGEKRHSICNTGNIYHDGYRFQALGVRSHYTSPCGSTGGGMFGGPYCLGKWAARNTDHWLWQGSGLIDDERFGFGREGIDPLTGESLVTYALGHEADTWVHGMPIPGLAAGQNPVILAEGVELTNYRKRVNNLLDTIDDEPLTCEEIIDAFISRKPPEKEPEEENTIWPETAGTILYFPHNSGGHVLVIGASATPWALESDAALSGLLQRALECFAYGVGCGGFFLADIEPNGSDG